MTVRLHTRSQMSGEVIVADDGSTDGTLEWLDSFPFDKYPFEIVYVTRKHKGYRLASLNNMAAKYARGSRILFTNADQIHSPKSFDAHFSLAPDVVGGGVFKGIGLTEKLFLKPAMLANFPRFLSLIRNKMDGKTNVDYVRHTNPNIDPIGMWGGNISVPAMSFWDVGGFDEEYDIGWGGEENDLVIRLVRNGARAEWVYDSVVYHVGHFARPYHGPRKGSVYYMEHTGRKCM